MSPINQVPEDNIFKSNNEQPPITPNYEVASLDERLRLWEKRCLMFEKQLEKSKIIKEKEISRLMDRISKERERAAKYRKKTQDA